MQVSDIKDIALILVVSGMLLGVGVLILQDSKDATAYIECEAGFQVESGHCCPALFSINASDTSICVNDTVGGNNAQAAGTATSPVNTSFDDGIGALGELGDWMDTIALVIAATIIIGLVLLFRRNRI